MDKKFKEIDMYEALCLAVSINEERSEFYERLAEGAENKQVKNELLFLRDEERNNADYFARRLEELEGKESSAGSCDPERLLHQWVEKEIILPFQNARNTEGVKNSMEALRLGTELQRKTIEFYTELISHEKSAKEKDELSNVLVSEKQHLKKLNLIMSY